MIFSDARIDVVMLLLLLPADKLSLARTLDKIPDYLSTADLASLGVDLSVLPCRPTPSAGLSNESCYSRADLEAWGIVL